MQLENSDTIKVGAGFVTIFPPVFTSFGADKNESCKKYLR